jgi:hypothetical protein
VHAVGDMLKKAAGWRWRLVRQCQHDGTFHVVFQPGSMETTSPEQKCRRD